MHQLKVSLDKAEGSLIHRQALFEHPPTMKVLAKVLIELSVAKDVTIQQLLRISEAKEVVKCGEYDISVSKISTRDPVTGEFLKEVAYR